MLDLHRDTVPDEDFWRAAVLSSGDVLAIRSEGYRKDVISVVSLEMSLRVGGWVVHDTNSRCEVSHSVVLQESNVLLGVTATEAVDPLQLELLRRGLLLVHWRSAVL